MAKPPVNLFRTRPDSHTLLVIGAGPIARALVQAHLQVRPGITHVLLWNRSAEKFPPLLDSLQQQGINARIAPDLATVVSHVDIISKATSATCPLIKGSWVTPGTHVDLVGSLAGEQSTTATLSNPELAAADIGTRLIGVEYGVVRGSSRYDCAGGIT
jgi:ornithine cyclodeaminase/alanine dehydrogenase-like protein (mu-crystallin family)